MAWVLKLKKGAKACGISMGVEIEAIESKPKIEKPGYGNMKFWVGENYYMPNEFN